MTLTIKTGFDFARNQEELEQRCREYFATVRELNRFSSRREAFLASRGAAAAVARSDVSAAIDSELDEQIRRAAELNKERFRLWKAIQEVLDRLRRAERFPTRPGSANPKPHHAEDLRSLILMQTQPTAPDFSACVATPIDRMILKRWQLIEHDTLKVLSPARSSGLQPSASVPNSYYSTVLEAPTSFRFHVWGGPDGLAYGSTVWGVPIDSVNCGVEIYCGLTAGGLVDIESGGYVVPVVSIDLQVIVSQYRFPGVDWVQVPYWAESGSPGFFGGEQYIPYRSWQAYPDPDFSNWNPSISYEEQAGVHPIKPHKAALSLALSDVQEGDFFLLKSKWSVFATRAHVDFSWNNVGLLVAAAPFVVKYD